jgi:hypothetical protein
MQHIVFINPLKVGKLKAYKIFSAENTGPRKEENNDLLKRYGLLTTKVYYHNLGGKEFVIVIHGIEKDAKARLEKFATSNHPYDQWFLEQLRDLHDFDEVGEAQFLFSYDTKK